MSLNGTPRASLRLRTMKHRSTFRFCRVTVLCLAAFVTIARSETLPRLEGETLSVTEVRLKHKRHVLLQLFLPAAVVSLALVLPCIWQPHIESADLATHIYNAWLTRLIATEHLPGLWIKHQFTNVAFDYLVTWLLGVFGPLAAERISVLVAVLIFFWGTFTFMSEVGGRRPWFLLPCLAMLAYGRVFYLGFFNSYLSTGFSFLALAMLWRPKPSPWRWILAAGAIMAAYFCHPFPSAWAIGTGAYILAARNRSRRDQAVLFSASVLVIAAVGLLQRLRLPHAPVALGEGVRRLVSALGWDQVVVFQRPVSGMSYRFVELGIIVILGSLAIPRFIKQPEFRVSLLVQLYALTGVALLVLQDDFVLTLLFANPLGFIRDRLSLIAAVLACSLVAGAHPGRWQRAGLISLAALYFVLLYQDQRVENQIEAKVTQLVAQLPPRQRVSALLPYRGVVGEADVDSIVDRACVGRCFSYGDYEPSSQQFRIRVAGDNAFVLASDRDVHNMEAGTYVVQRRDLPLYQIYRCGPGTTDLCTRPLAAGDVNGEPTRARSDRYR
jgi:hypothetical protein